MQDLRRSWDEQIMRKGQTTYKSARIQPETSGSPDPMTELASPSSSCSPNTVLPSRSNLPAAATAPAVSGMVISIGQARYCCVNSATWSVIPSGNMLTSGSGHGCSGLAIDGSDGVGSETSSKGTSLAGDAGFGSLTPDCFLSSHSSVAGVIHLVNVDSSGLVMSRGPECQLHLGVRLQTGLEETIPSGLPDLAKGPKESNVVQKTKKRRARMALTNPRPHHVNLPLLRTSPRSFGHSNACSVEFRADTATGLYTVATRLTPAAFLARESRLLSYTSFLHYCSGGEV